MKRFFAAVVASAMVNSAQAGTVVCGGTITYLAFHAPNTFMIQMSSMNTPVFFCNPEATFSVTGTTYTTGPNTCKTLYASFLAVKASGGSIAGIYFDGDDTPATCDAWGAWKSANIRYFAF
jgi:hypothetical protein